MIGFTGFYQNHSLLAGYDHYLSILFRQSCFTNTPKDENYILTERLALCANEYFQIGTESERLFIALYGSISNTDSLCLDPDLGIRENPSSLSDEEIILLGFRNLGTALFPKLEGDFSFILFDERNACLYLVRDGFGCKPLFYSDINGLFLFGTRLKYLLANPHLQASISRDGLNEIFSLGPSRTPGSSVYDLTHEVRPGFYVKCDSNGILSKRYYKLETKPHTDPEEDTMEKNLDLLKEATRKCLRKNGDTGIGSLLSGGIDSSIVSALVLAELEERGKDLSTFSFEFTENEQYYQKNDFQPSLDRPYVEEMAEFLGSYHSYLSCSPKELFNSLSLSVQAHDLPAMGDVDSSLIFFMDKLPKNITGVFAGECADEIYGGYPWFHRENMIYADTFPWMADHNPRKILLKDEFIEFLGMDDYIHNAYHNTLSEIEYLPDESKTDQTLRRNEYLSITWFMQTLLNRMERAAAVTGVKAFCPFVDRPMVEYAYNMPWSLKSKNCVAKSILRESSTGLLPDAILNRKKSPFPKTYHPGYEALLRERIQEIMSDASSPLHFFIDKKKMEDFLSHPLSYHTPWYGQLMAGPQMLAYLIQVDEWLRTYHVSINM